ncbi:MAG: GFA family protein [Cohaesibacter sp.]|nr:GFA family protein [Cohaesibacter sp.]
MIEGRCDCGKVHFQLEKVRETVTICHCSQCRRTSGHLWAATRADTYEALTFLSDEGLSWYQSSDFASRGFCHLCGSSLFYKKKDEEGVGIAAGCLELPTGLSVGKHIFVKDKGDYYEIADTAPQIERF